MKQTPLHTVPHSPFPPVETEKEAQQRHRRELLTVIESVADDDYDHGNGEPFRCGTPTCAWGHALVHLPFIAEGILEDVDWNNENFFGFPYPGSPLSTLTYSNTTFATRTDVINELKKHDR